MAPSRGSLRPSRRTGPRAEWRSHELTTDVVVLRAPDSPDCRRPAGLVAAGRSVVVLEARDRVGGRTEAGELARRQRIELGGQWVGPTQDRMYELIAELGLETFPHLQRRRHRLPAARASGRWPAAARARCPKLNPFAVADLAQGTLRFAAAGAARSTSTSRGGRPTPRARRPDLPQPGCSRNLRTAAGPGLLRARTARRSSRRPLPTCRCCTRCSTPTPAPTWTR